MTKSDLHAEQPLLKRIVEALDRLDGRLATLERASQIGPTPTPDWARSEEGLDLRDIIVPDVSDSSAISLDFESEVRRVARDSLDAVEFATRSVLAALPKSDLASLAKKNRAFAGFDWSIYLRLSKIRIAMALEEIRRRGVLSGRVLDYGSYFGNFALAAAKAGYAVDAFDSYRDYEGAFTAHQELLAESQVTILDAADVGFELQRLPENSYDAVLMMGVVEHIPSSPRLVLEGIKRVLKPGAPLILDTPNLGYAYARRRLAAGQSIFPSISAQYWSDLPFSGHHREFTMSEIGWMLEGGLGMADTRVESFSFSLLGLPELSGLDLSLWRLMQSHATLREVIFASARKPH